MLNVKCGAGATLRCCWAVSATVEMLWLYLRLYRMNFVLYFLKTEFHLQYLQIFHFCAYLHYKILSVE
jgi:hypothetical protein